MTVSGKPNRRNTAPRQHQKIQQALVAPNLWKINNDKGTIVKYCGIEGGASPDEFNKIQAAQGYVWVLVDVPRINQKLPVKLDVDISEVMSKGVGSLVGRSVTVRWAGSTAEDFSNGLCKFSPARETYSHPDRSAPVSVGGFNGVYCQPENYCLLYTSPSPRD